MFNAEDTGNSITDDILNKYKDNVSHKGGAENTLYPGPTLAGAP